MNILDFVLTFCRLWKPFHIAHYYLDYSCCVYQCLNLDKTGFEKPADMVLSHSFPLSTMISAIIAAVKQETDHDSVEEVELLVFMTTPIYSYTNPCVFWAFL